MAALVLRSVPASLSFGRAFAFNWPRVAAYSGSFSLHLLIALLLLVPPAAMKLREMMRDDSIVVTIPSAPLPAVREPDLPVPPIRIKKIPPAPPRPQITITAPIPAPMPTATPVDSIAPPADRAVPAAPADSGAATDSAPTTMGYGTQTKITYPRTALANRIEGTVILRVLVGEDGSVKDIEIDKSSGSRDLDRAAREGVMKWKFKPGMRGGVAYAGWARVPISFTLP